MLGLTYRSSKRIRFKQLDQLPIPCLYILSMMNIVVNNPEKFQSNLSVHYFNTRQKNHLHRPTICFPPFKKGWHIQQLNSLIAYHLTL